MIHTNFYIPKKNLLKIIYYKISLDNIKVNRHLFIKKETILFIYFKINRYICKDLLLKHHLKETIGTERFGSLFTDTMA